MRIVKSSASGMVGVPRLNLGFSGSAFTLPPTINYAPSYSVSVATAFSVTPSQLDSFEVGTDICSITPAPPAGVSFNSATCVLSGIVAVESVFNFTVTATNTVGSTGVSFSVSSMPVVVPPVLGFSSSNLTVSVYTSFTATPSLLENFVVGTDSCAIAPAPPASMSFNTSTCVLHGYPTVGGNYNFTITATNGVGSGNAPLNITVVTPLSYTNTNSTGLVGKPLTVTPGQAITYTNCEASPALPTWASLDPSTCVITGTPDAALVATNYTITGTYALGTHVASLQLRVLASRLRIMPNASVSDIHVDGNQLYVAGNFTHFNLVTASGGAITKRTGCNSTGCLPLSSQLMPTFNGSIFTIIPDQAGGFYVGGSFSVSGTTITNLAHIMSDGSVDLNFKPNPNNTVHGLAYDNNRLWVVGGFTTVAGEPRSRFAVMNTTYGTLSHESVSFNSTAFSVSVDDQFVYVGGQFTAVQGTSRNFLARLNRVTYQVDAMDLAVNNSVLGIHIDATHIYLRGNFATVSGLARTHIAQIERANLTPTSLSLTFSGGAPRTWAFRGSEMYLGGPFTTINGISRNRIGAVDLGIGTLMSFDPSPNNTVNSLFVEGDRLLVGGLFSTIQGQGRAYLAEINLLTTTLESQSHFAAQSVTGVSASGSLLLFASSIQPVRYSNHRYITRIDLTENEILHSPLDINNSVTSVLTDSTRVYLQGSFTSVNASARSNLAILDKTNLGLMGSDYVTNGAVSALALANGKLFVGGSFTSFGGSARNRLAVVDTATLALTSDVVNVDQSIHAMAASPTNLFLSGAFLTVNGTAVNNFAIIDQGSMNLTGVSLSYPLSLVASFEYREGKLGISGKWEQPCISYEIGDYCDMSGYTATDRYNFSKAYSDIGAEIESFFHEFDATGWEDYSYPYAHKQRASYLYEIRKNGSNGGGMFLGSLSRPGLSRTINGIVYDVEEASGRVFFAGSFDRVNASITPPSTLLGGVTRTHLAAMDLTTGTLEN